MKKLIAIAALSISMLTGCSVGHQQYSATALEKADITFTGIPTVLGIGTVGTTIPLTENYSLTAAHVANTMVGRTKAVHPSCDLAIVYKHNSKAELAKWATPEVGDKVAMYGYSIFTALPVESHGKNLARVPVKNSYNTSCVAMASDSGVVKGMSGGPVYNEKGKAVGVIIGFTKYVRDGYNKYRDVSLYIPYDDFADWLKENTKD